MLLHAAHLHAALVAAVDLHVMPVRGVQPQQTAASRAVPEQIKAKGRQNKNTDFRLGLVQDSITTCGSSTTKPPAWYVWVQ
jgi:hypothetical protein